MSLYKKRRRRWMLWAIKIVGQAVERGLIPRADKLRCVDCGKRARHWEHRNYLHPLRVEPTCRSCNYKRGPGKSPNRRAPKWLMEWCGYEEVFEWWGSLQYAASFGIKWTPELLTHRHISRDERRAAKRNGS